MDTHPTFNAQQVELARKVVAQFKVDAPQGVEVGSDTVEGDMLTIGVYSLVWCIVEGQRVIQLDRYNAYPYRYMEPPDGDVIVVGKYKSIDGALAAMVACDAEQAVHNYLQSLLEDQRAGQEAADPLP